MAAGSVPFLAQAAQSLWCLSCAMARWASACRCCCVPAAQSPLRPAQALCVHTSESLSTRCDACPLCKSCILCLAHFMYQLPLCTWQSGVAFRGPLYLPQTDKPVNVRRTCWNDSSHCSNACDRQALGTHGCHRAHRLLHSLHDRHSTG